MGVKDAVKQVLIKQQDKKYERQLAQRRVIYHEWVREEEAKRTIARGDLGEAVTDIVIFVRKNTRFGEEALKEIKAYFAANPQVELLYGDEDLLLADSGRAKPWYKPCWSPDLYCSRYYLGSVVAVRRELFEKAAKETKQGVCVVEFESVLEIRSLMQALITEAGGFKKGCNKIGHVDYILASVEEEDIWQEYLSTPGVPDEYVSASENKELVSVIIPSKDNPKVLEVCLKSLCLEKRTDVEVIVVDNGSTPENKAKIEALVAKLQESAGGKISYLYQPEEFNFSHMCNMGAEHSSGKFLLFLNDDMEMCDDDWLELMRDKAARDYVGAVGLKLYYPNSERMQHAGIVNMSVGPMHKLQFLEDDKMYYFGRNKFNYNCVAVTGACLMLERKKFWEVGGFKEELRVAYNDVELGFALAEQGYQNVVLNERYAYHHESLSRGNDDTREKIERLERERLTLYRMHPEFKGEDPYYPAKLNRQGVDFRVAPDYVNAKNTLQKGKCVPLPYKWEELHQDKCLMVGVECNEAELIQGYSVVLGDDNACYERYLVLIPESENGQGSAEEKRSETEGKVRKETVCVKLEGQYRQDLEENIPDQVNVALCGFCVNIEGAQLPKGNYRIAVLAINKVTGLKLINDSGKSLKNGT